MGVLADAGVRIRGGSRWQPLAKAVARLLLTAACAAAIGNSERARAASEYEVKAAFLYTFAQFTEWPGEAFAGPIAPLVIGIVGADPFGHVLDDALKGELIHARPVIVRRFQRGENLTSCHVLFVSSSEKRQLPQILAEVKGSHALTISEVDRFGYFGGIITFTMEGPRVRFEINLRAAEQAGLKISSKVLKLAKITGAEQ